MRVVRARVICPLRALCCIAPFSPPRPGRDTMASIGGYQPPGQLPVDLYQRGKC